MREQILKIIKNNLKWFILFVALIGFLAIAEDVFDKDIMQLDLIGYKFISTALISETMTPVAKMITGFASAPFIIILSIGLFVLIRNKRVGVAISINLVLVVGLNQMLKNILQRPRPTEYRLIEETGYSFPSGHSMVSMAFYGFLIYLIYKNVKNQYLKWGAIIFLSILIFLIGISRIYLGVHYTSDVLAGFLLSISYLIVYTSIVRNFLKDNKEVSNRE